MLAVNLTSLIDKLNNHCRQALEAAVGSTLSRTHYNVEIEHWLLKLLEEPNGDLSLILRPPRNGAVSGQGRRARPSSLHQPPWRVSGERRGSLTLSSVQQPNRLH